MAGGKGKYSANVGEEIQTGKILVN